MSLTHPSALFAPPVQPNAEIKVLGIEVYTNTMQGRPGSGLTNGGMSVGANRAMIYEGSSLDQCFTKLAQDKDAGRYRIDGEGCALAGNIGTPENFRVQIVRCAENPALNGTLALGQTIDKTFTRSTEELIAKTHSAPCPSTPIGDYGES